MLDFLDRMIFLCGGREYALRILVQQLQETPFATQSAYNGTRERLGQYIVELT